MKPYTNAWKRVAQKSTLHDNVVHAALKAFFSEPSNKVSKEEIFRGQVSKFFTPVTNNVKIVNGHWEFISLFQVFEYFRVNLRVNIKFPFLGMKNEDFITEVFDDSQENYHNFIKFFRENISKNMSRSDFDKFRKRYYCYIFVKQEGCEPIYQAVQAAHVAMVIGKNMDKDIIADEVVFQICKVKNTDEMDCVWMDLLLHNYEVEYFYEPDKDNYFAMGILPVPSYKRQFLQNYELLTF
jgi:hypothetical protein